MVERHVILLGKVGHGKSSIANKLCGESFESNMSVGSCTRSINKGISLIHQFGVIDTPGFFASDQAAEHAAIQKEAMESTELSAILLVVKIGRADEMAETLNQLMDFCDDDDVCVIVTFADTVEGNDESAETDISAIQKRLSLLLEIEMSNIIFVGKETPSSEIEDFIHQNMIEPKSFRVSNVQVASLASQSVGAVRYDKDIKSILELIEAAKLFCAQTTNTFPSSESDFVEAKQALIRSAFEEAGRLAKQQCREVCARAEQELATLAQEQELKSRVAREIAEGLRAFQEDYPQTKVLPSSSLDQYSKGKHKGSHQTSTSSRKKAKLDKTQRYNNTKYNTESTIELTELPGRVSKPKRRPPFKVSLEKEAGVRAWKAQVWMSGERTTLEGVHETIKKNPEKLGAQTAADNSNSRGQQSSNHADMSEDCDLSYMERFICPCFRWWQRSSSATREKMD